ARRPWWRVTPFATDSDAADEDSGREAFTIEATPAQAYRGDTARVIGDVGQWLADRWRGVLVTEGHGPAQRLPGPLPGGGPRGPRGTARRSGSPSCSGARASAPGSTTPRIPVRRQRTASRWCPPG